MGIGDRRKGESCPWGGIKQKLPVRSVYYIDIKRHGPWQFTHFWEFTQHNPRRTFFVEDRYTHVPDIKNVPLLGSGLDPPLHLPHYCLIKQVTYFSNKIQNRFLLLNRENLKICKNYRFWKSKLEPTDTYNDHYKTCNFLHNESKLIDPFMDEVDGTSCQIIKVQSLKKY